MSISRRDFIKGAAVAAGGAVIAGCAPKMVSTEEAPAAAGAESGYNWLTAPAPIAAADIKETIDADIVIVGAGLGGLSTAVSALENGAKVVVVEKGSTWTGRGGGIGVVDSRKMRDAGVSVDKVEVARKWHSMTANRANEELVWLFLNECGNAMDWLLDKADAVNLPYFLWDGYYKGDIYTEHPGYHMFMGGPKMMEGMNPCADVSFLLYNEAVDKGATFLFDSPAEQLVKEDDRVTAVIVKTADGYKRINGTKGVVLATGDIGGDEEMCKAYAPFAVKGVGHNGSQYTPVGVNTGDGHKMGMWVGGAIQETPFPTMVHPQAFSWLQYCFLYVNQEGQRFMAEDNWVQARSLKIAAQKKGDQEPWGWALIDADWPTKVKASLPYGGGMFWDNFRVDGAEWTPDGDQATIDGYLKDGKIAFQADTLEALAEKMGVPADEFVATVKRYNELCETGVDSDFGKRSELMMPIDKAPFTALKYGGALLTVVGGLKIDTKMRVLDADKNPVAGLYAVGNASGDLYATDYPITVPGNSHARALTWGYLAGKNIMEA